MIDEQGDEPLELTSEATEEDLTQAETGENGTGEAETAETTEEVEEQPKKGKSVQERIDELYGRSKDAEREAEYWRNIALQHAPKPTEAEPEVAKRPDPNDYEHGDADAQYWEDLTDWKADQLITKRLAEHSEKQAVRDQATELDRTYAENLAKVREEIPDYDDTVTNAGKQGKWACSEQMAGLIKSSPVGPRVAHYLATNPEESGAIANLPPIQQAAAFGMIAAQYVNQPAPKANIATNAPAPAPARTKGGQFAPTNELRDDLDLKEWQKRREQQVRSRA